MSLLHSSFLRITFIRSLNVLSSFRVVDNSELGKLKPTDRAPYVISRHKKKIYDIGDVVTVAIKGKTCKAMIVGVKKRGGLFVPSTATNNIILLDENCSPLGTRITVPLPIILKHLQKGNTKVLSMATKFI